MILLLLIPIFPFAAAMLLSTPGKLVRNKAGVISSIFTFASLMLIIILRGSTGKIGTIWFSTSAFKLTFSLMIGGLEWLAALITAITGLAIGIFSIKFIEERQQFYFRVFSFFIGSMLMLVLSDSFILTFISWEFIGLSSFLLIGFWYREPEARAASSKAFLMTRIGDFGFLLAFLLIITNTGSTDITSFINNLNSLRVGPELLSFLFLTAALGKSAQLPFTSWLPDAMAGPAPVSALIHSATMVAAGVFLLLKLFPLFEASEITLNFIIWIGGITALTAALIASTRFDLKRILAWSTISQLGEMYFVIGIGGALASAFHLAVHAVFKAGLFLTAGVISHSTGIKDIRNLGSLRKHLPYTAAVFFVCGLALSGFPPFAGFWSEDEIIAEAITHGPGYPIFMLVLIFLAGVYISRAGVSVFGGWNRRKYPEKYETGKALMYPMLFLAALALISGYVLKLNIESILHIAAAPEISWLWKTGAIAVSSAGLSYGAFRVLKSGPVPSFGNQISYLTKLVDLFVIIPVKIIQICSMTVNLIEEILDSSAKKASTLILTAAGVNTRIESAFDLFAHRTSELTLNAAGGISKTDESGISDNADRFAFALSSASEKLHKLQSGKIFLYTIILFSWIIITTLVAGIFFIL